MAEHEPCIGATDDWYTPPNIFDALGLIFDLDPCSPGPAHWVPARKIYTKEDDGLVQPWSGNGRGSEQGAGAVRARLLRADRYLRCESNQRRGTALAQMLELGTPIVVRLFVVTACIAGWPAAFPFFF